MLSKFVHAIKVTNDVFALYNSLVFEPIFVSGKDLDLILNDEILDVETIDVLYKKHIFVKSPDSDEKALTRLSTKVFSNTRKLSLMYLIVSSQCNLACKYCFIENNPESRTCPGSMDIFTARKAVDMFCTEIKGEDETNAQIIIYGGEPLINREVLIDIVPYIRKRLPSIKLMLITNATLMDQEVALLLAENDVGTGVSLDGPKEINDRNRVFRNENLSVYDKVSESIRIMNEAGCNFCISITVTQAVLEHEESVFEWLKHLGIKYIFWNLYHFQSYTDGWKDYYEQMSDFVLRMDEKLAPYGIVDGRVAELLELFEHNTFRFQSCGAIGLNQVAVTPNGKVCICHGDSRNEKMFIGDIYSEESFSDMLRKDLPYINDHLYTLCHDECRRCEALYVCGGGCPAHAETLFGARAEIDYAACVFYKKYLRWILSKYLEANN